MQGLWIDQMGIRGYLVKIIGFLSIFFLILALGACNPVDDCSNSKEGASTSSGKKCDKEEEIPSDDNSSNSNDITIPAPGPSSGQSCNIDHFQQPNVDQQSKKVDILFVMDTSGSMQDDWDRVAQNIGYMVKEMPRDADIRYGVILGHTGTYSGKLFATGHEPLVLKNSVMSNDAIANSLRKTFSAAMWIDDPGSGEALFHSLYFAVTKNAKENQDKGFFRADAALSVLFMSDEQEIGFPFPEVQASGLPYRCDADYEDSIKKKYYDKMGINLDTTYNAVKSFKGDMPLSMHAFVNITADDLFRRNSRKSRCLYDSLGYGYFDMVQKTSGVLFSIQEDRALGMAKVGQAVKQSLELQSDFQLSWSAKDIDPKTIAVKVDDVTNVSHSYNATSNIVHLDSYLGHAQSMIDISYCAPNIDPIEWSIAGFSGDSETTSITLTWKTSSAKTKGKIFWGDNANTLQNIAVEQDFATEHTLTFNHLLSNTTYYFQLTAADENGVEHSTAVIDISTKKIVEEDPAPIPDWQVMGLDGTTTSNSATIIWQTPGVSTTAVLKLGLSANDFSFRSVSIAEATEIHLITLDGLAANTLYYFQVIATDTTGKAVTSNVISKRTKLP